jgi:hypothetical protein
MPLLFPRMCSILGRLVLDDASCAVADRPRLPLLFLAFTLWRAANLWPFRCDPES